MMNIHELLINSGPDKQQINDTVNRQFTDHWASILIKQDKGG